MELAHKSGLYNLWKNGKVQILNCMGGWGLKPEDWKNYETNKIKGRTYFVWHQMVYQGKLPWPGCTDPMAAKLLRKYPQYDLIVTGDNHKPFVEEYEGRILVNVGSMMRTTADQIDYKPAVWLWYAETNTVEKVYLPIEENVISREHLEIKEQRDNRMNAFIEKMDDSWDAGLSFEQNLEAYKKTNKVKKSVMSIIYQSLD
jgi:predicted phosphodiesterase